ncbi:Arm repeat superfamily protein, partial [Thalictrum thalictroides]
YSVLDTLLRVLEALSVLDNHSEVISSSEELLQLIYNLIKLPDKFEVSSSCITAVVLIANVMTDKPDLASGASQDSSLLQGLLSLIPFVSNDLEARNALWSILGRVLVRVQEDEMSPSSLHQYVMVLVNKSDFIEEDLIDHRDEDSNKYHQNSNTSYVKETARTTSLSRICSILQRWITIGENIVKKDAIGEVCADHENVEKLLQCCRNYTM